MNHPLYQKIEDAIDALLDSTQFDNDEKLEMLTSLKASVDDAYSDVELQKASDEMDDADDMDDEYGDTDDEGDDE